MYLCGERNRFQNGGVTHDGRDSDILRLLAGQKVNRLACGESHIIVGTEDGRAYVQVGAKSLHCLPLAPQTMMYSLRVNRVLPNRVPYIHSHPHCEDPTVTY